MHKFLIKDEQGSSKDWGSSNRAAEHAIKTVGEDAVCAVQGSDVLWLLPEHADYFRGLIGEFKITNTARDVLNHADQSRRTNAIPANAERVRHAKLGAGSVINRQEARVLVMFDSQKKPVPVHPDFLVACE